MDVDAQHFKGQGIDEPSQPEENAVALRRPDALLMIKASKTKTRTAKPIPQKEISHSDGRIPA